MEGLDRDEVSIPVQGAGVAASGSQARARVGESNVEQLEGDGEAVMLSVVSRDAGVSQDQ
jgi:hypothetical protein